MYNNNNLRSFYPYVHTSAQDELELNRCYAFAIMIYGEVPLFFLYLLRIIMRSFFTRFGADLAQFAIDKKKQSD